MQGDRRRVAERSHSRQVRRRPKTSASLPVRRRPRVAHGRLNGQRAASAARHRCDVPRGPVVVLDAPVTPGAIDDQIAVANTRYATLRRVVDPATTALELDGPGAPTLLAGTRLLGEFEGAGYREAPHLVARGDGQLVRLPALLHTLLALLVTETDEPDDLDEDGEDDFSDLDWDEESDEDDLGAGSGVLQWVQPPVGGYRGLPEIADALRRETAQPFRTEHVAFLVDKKLAPLGLTTYTDGTIPTLAKANPFLALKLRATVLSERTSWRVGGLLAWLHHPYVMIPALGAFIVAELLVFQSAQSATVFTDVFSNPVSVLVVAALAIASAAFHEAGHVAACRYGGVAPGTMGVGIYVVWPAFYTDITRTYELGRGGRLRADLGGVYFNAIFLIGLIGLYVATGYPPFLVAALATNFEIIQQLLPSLRFDGYYIISDLAGVPDLFKYIGPIVRRVVLRRPADPRLAELKDWPQRLVATWVLLVIPALLAQLIYVAAQLPEIIQSNWDEGRRLFATISASGHPGLDTLAVAVRVLFLALPIVGVLYIVFSIVRTLATRALQRRSTPATPQPAAASTPS